MMIYKIEMIIATLNNQSILGFEIMILATSYYTKYRFYIDMPEMVHTMNKASAKPGL